MERYQFRERLAILPEKPGVYLFKDSQGKTLYVGKASSLRDRVGSYFSSQHTIIPKIRKMMELADDLDFIITDSEVEAVMLECTLIKKLRPPFNVRLKDDKSYPYIKVSLNEEWPRVFPTRRFIDDGGRYFGPYSSAKAVRNTLDLLKKLFKYCSPRGVITGRKSRPCFDYYIGRCVGACSSELSKEEYREIINEVVLFLEGKHDDVVRMLREKMEDASDSLQFEKAAAIRDQLQAVQHIAQIQKVVSTSRDNQDVIALARDRNEAYVQVFYIRDGTLVEKEQFVLEGTQDEEPGSIISNFLVQFYSSATYIPSCILLQAGDFDIETITTWLRNACGKKVRLEVPRRGRKRRLVEMVEKNAVQGLEQRKAKWLADTGKTAAALKELYEKLGLPRLPNRIECYDISNIRGTSAVGSMAVFENGRRRTSHYRRFQIKTVDSIDDYAMMKEVIKRRFKRLGSQTTGSWDVVPDLVLIDGGRGHLNAVYKAVEELGLDAIPLASIAKEHEDIFVPGRKGSIILPRDSQALYLLQRIRDEAHRFAITYHRKVRQRSVTSSLLDIPGIGAKRKRALIRQFGSIKGIRGASIEEITAVPGMTRYLAERLKQSL